MRSRSSRVVRASGCQYQCRNSPGCSIPASSDTVESEGRQMKQCWISYICKKNQKKPPLKFFFKSIIKVLDFNFITKRMSELIQFLIDAAEKTGWDLSKGNKYGLENRNTSLMKIAYCSTCYLFYSTIKNHSNPHINLTPLFLLTIVYSHGVRRGKSLVQTQHIMSNRHTFFANFLLHQLLLVPDTEVLSNGYRTLIIQYLCVCIRDRRILSPWLGDVVNSGIGLSYCPAYW